MKYKSCKIAAIFAITVSTVSAQKAKTFTVASPDAKMVVTLGAAAKLNWSVKYNSAAVIAPSSVSLTLDNGEVLGDNATIISSKTISVNTVFNTPVYKKEIGGG